MAGVLAERCGHCGKLCHCKMPAVFDFEWMSASRLNVQGMVDDAGECALRDSGKHYTVVRPGQLTNDAASQHKLTTGSCPSHVEHSHGLIQLTQQDSRAESCGPVVSLCTAQRFLCSLLFHAGCQAPEMWCTAPFLQTCV